MKKALKIIGITLLVLFAALLILPFAFQGKLVRIVKTEANKMLNAKLDFDKLSLSFIRNFPKATVSLTNLSVVGTGEFEGDTLAAAGKILVTVNIKSLFGDSGYEISKVLLERPVIHAIVHENGKANWDIMKESEAPETPVAEDTTASSFKLILQKLSITNASITYRDDLEKMAAALRNLNVTLSGDMGADRTTLKTNITIDTLDFTMGKVAYLSKANLALDMKVDADLKNNRFTFDQNTLRLNAIEAGFDGWLALLDNGFDMDIKLNTSKIDFKQILSLIPAVYAKDFDGLKATGDVQLSAAAKGRMEGDNLPAFDVKLVVGNARFQYPDLPKSVDNIAIDAEVTNPGGVADLTKIDVRKFHFEMAGNPFDVALKVATPVSDAAVSGTAKGKIDLGMVKEVYPLDAGMSLNGLLTADLKFAAHLSQIEKEQYENISAEGNLLLKGMTYKSADLPEVLINTAELNFTPRYVALNSLDVKIGRNDVAATGRLENFIPYVMKDATLKGTLNVHSTYFNANDFMSDTPEQTATAAADTAAMVAFEVPKNLDFALDANFKEIIFDNINLKNTVGKVTVKDGKAELKDLRTNALNGTIALNGYYSTAVDPKKPDVNMGIDIQNASFVETFKTFNLVQKLAPIFENMTGIYSVKLNMKTSLDEHFSPNLQTLMADGVLQSKEVKVQDVAALNALAKAVNNDKLKTLSVKDLKLPFQIKEGRVYTNPFDINTGVGKINLSGSTGLDQTIDYKGSMDIPQSVVGDKLGGRLTASLSIKGTFKSPKVEVNTKEMVNQVIDVAKEEANKKISEELQKQVDKLKAEAKKAGESLMAEADKQGQNLIKEANKTSNPIAKVAAVKAAEAAAKKLNDEAAKKAQQLNDEADKQAQALMQKAVIK